MQAKLLFLFVLVVGSIVTCTEGFGYPGAWQKSMGRKREVSLCFGFNYIQQFAFL